MEKSRTLLLIWFIAGLMWTVFGLLYLFRLHYWFPGICFLALGATSLFSAWRIRRKQLLNPTPHDPGMRR